MSELTLKLGKLPPEENAYKFKFADFRGAAVFPPTPNVFGHTDLVADLLMLANDQFGCCVWSGAAHETMLWTAAAGRGVTFTDNDVLSDYSVVTGFSPNVPSTDRGTSMEAAAKYRRKTGVIDAGNARHKVDAYLELSGVSARGTNSPSLLDSIAGAAYVFGTVGIGIEFPASAMEQFNNGAPWSVVEGSNIEGGHYIPVVGRALNGNFLVVTWGKIQEATPEFLLKYVDEAIVYVSLESLKDGSTIDGFDVAGLQSALSALGGGTIETPTPAPTPVPTPDPTPEPVAQTDVQYLDEWAAARHTKPSNIAATKAWQRVRDEHNL